MGDLARQFARKQEMLGRALTPMPDRVWAGRVVERRVHLDSRQMTCVMFEPVMLRQMLWIKITSPVVEAPGA